MVKNMNIMVDLDGVLCDWPAAACKLCKVDIKDPKIRAKLKVPGALVDDIVGSATMWKRINAAGSDWWASIEPYPWTRTLYKEMSKIGSVALLTSPGNTVAAACQGKIEWIRNNLKGAKYLITKAKYFCASSHSILIDDFEKYVNQFVDAGGFGFQWPNGLSLLDGDIDVDDVIKALMCNIEAVKSGSADEPVRLGYDE